jgi:outer membrane protein assembly factor BamB
MHKPRQLLMAIAVCLILVFRSGLAFGEPKTWPQFRGPEGRSLAEPNARPPIHFGLNSNVFWNVDVPAGHSSPAIWGDRIFITAQDHEQLETICLDRLTGKTLWTAEVQVQQLEPTHRISNPAASTPITDGSRVYSYFGSYGLLCHDNYGKQIWTHPLPTPMTEFGSGTSPVLAERLLILNRDGDINSSLLALDKLTGKVVWETARTEFRRGFATPFIWHSGNRTEVVVPGSLWLKSYDFNTGKELWMAHGFARVANASPTSGDGLLFLSSWNVGGDADDRVSMESWEVFAGKQDKNKDGILTRGEFPPGVVAERFTQIDLDKDGRVTREEYENMRMMFTKAENALVAIKSGGKGDVTDSHVVWKQQRALPYVSSALWFGGRVYTIKSGGLVSCYDAKSGKIHYQAERLGAPGDYYASAIGAGEAVYFISQNGAVTVIAAGDELKILGQTQLNDQVFASPAVIGEALYIRTAGHLYAFKEALIH